MKIRLLNILMIAIFFSCDSTSNTKNTTIKTDKIDIETLEKEGFEVYRNSPKKAIPIFIKLASEYEKLNDLNKAGFTNLNIANIYDEHLNQVDSALIFSEKSLGIWRSKNDSMQMANLYKYIGLLKGKKGQFEEAKYAIQKAIKIYKDQDFHQGVAISKINLADVYFRKKEFEKSIVYFKKSKEFWLQKNDKGRVYTDNILGIKIFAAMKKDEQVERLIKENRKIEEESNINEFAKSKFDELINGMKEVNS